MPSDSASDLNMSKLSLHSDTSSQGEDWDRSLILNDSEPTSDTDESSVTANAMTPRNSVLFPREETSDSTPRSGAKGTPGAKGKRSLSELMRLHAEKGTDCNFSTEEAARIAEVLGQWINASSSPYEDEDDFFSRRSHDDLSAMPLRHSSLTAENGRLRGQSESAGSRPPSSAGMVRS